MPVHSPSSPLVAHVGPGRPASRGSSGEQRAWACGLWRLGPQHHAATGQGLINFFLRGIACGALTEDEARAAGLTLDELRTRSFLEILQGRRKS